jgi:hypothetical protein
VTLTGALIGALFLLPACVAVLWKRPAVRSSFERRLDRPEEIHVDLAGQGRRELQQD